MGFQALSQGGKYELFEDQCSAHLEIYESEVSDSGVYKCTAINSSGAVSTTCTVTVTGKKIRCHERIYSCKCSNVINKLMNVFHFRIKEPCSNL